MNERRMRVISRRTLREFGDKHAQAKAPLDAWYDVLTKRTWASVADFKRFFSRSVDTVGNGRYVFNIGDNFRLVALVNFPMQVAYVRFVGTHKEYDRIVDITSI